MKPSTIQALMPLLPRLKQLREEAALSQEELAKAAGVAKPTVLRLEQGKSIGRPSTVRKLAKALNVQHRELIRES